jgi:hypothetical protein
MRTAALVVALALVGTAAVADTTAPAARKGASSVEETLRAILDGKQELAPLVVTYSDLHGLHGGLRLSIDGRGRVRQEAVREKVGTPKPEVARGDLLKLVALLVDKRAWKQEVPERPPVPDESRASLSIAYGGGPSSTIWEWYNDLAETRAILPVRELMKRIAWW